MLIEGSWIRSMWICFGIKSYLRSCDLATKNSGHINLKCFSSNVCKSFFLMVELFLASCILTVPGAARFALLDCRCYLAVGLLLSLYRRSVVLNRRVLS